MPAGRVLVALSGNPYAASPTWTRYDELATCRCAGWEATTGRNGVFEVTDVGTATVHYADRNRTLDTDSLIGRAIMLQIHNPVSGVWEPSYRGVVDETTFDVYPMTGGLVSTVQLRCVDLFAWLGRVEMIPGVHGHVPTHGNEGSVVFGEQRVDDRIYALLSDTHTDSVDLGFAPNGVGKGAKLPPEMFVVFTGNVDLWDTAYDPGESILAALRDAADAEFPGVANVLCDRKGRVCFHGRRSRFDPEAVVGSPDAGDWSFTRWRAGDSGAIAADVSTAQARALTYSRASSLIYNTAIAWPKYVVTTKPSKVYNKRPFAEKDKDAQRAVDASSIADYGYRAMPPMGDLLVKRNFNNSNTGTVECQLYAAYYVANYKAVHRIPTVTFKSVHPDDPRAGATWALLTRIEISDVLNLRFGSVGMTGASPADDYFVEGWTKTVTPLTPTYDLVELTPNLSSVARYTVDPGLN